MKLNDFTSLMFYTPVNVPRYELMQSEIIAGADNLSGRLGLSKPLQIISGYRTPQENEQVGGVENSAHLRGAAIDVIVPASFYSMTGLQKFFREVIGSGFNAFGVYYTLQQGEPLITAHLEIREPKPSGLPYTWGGVEGVQPRYIGFERALAEIADRLPGPGLQLNKTAALVIIGLTALGALIYLIHR